MNTFNSISTVCSKLDPPVDYLGQHLVNRLRHTILIISIIISFILGYIYNNIFIMGGVYVILCLVCVIITVPAWGMYRRNPIYKIQ
ncbi:uncharacterized protein NESG_00503 [Nematocida ausubeli]|uniref:Signal peptidase complex subunit 1 n=1 Tax=Nematocida ausubeli (strain ATCC PRA-371 / ERTm2) TaxID=1913371 RepID=A0A086J5K6_NEMA1|nr:uncharacterized protein NESG_00503 [Nematocida ausubeli]KAI5134105.1 signal peptidase complex subunit 1 [Nematocida ausubeli]KAI5134107.1 signal peptidase complex subunit 1 [Nematocida ausubeli]KFG27424.1 hypothetical protein NESG_00503 [Nematocida ausubeli]